MQYEMEDLLRQYIKGEASENEKHRVVGWLEADPANMREYMALRKLYDISLWNTAFRQTTEQGKGNKHVLRRLALEVLKVAAALLIGFVGAQFLFEQSHEPTGMQTIHVPAGQRAEVTLSDGTNVWLNSHSTLKFPVHFEANARNVELDGEGYFTVAHNESRPFTVQTKQYAIHVLGTEFNVRAYHSSDLFETALLEGSVEISTQGKSENLRLKPNQIVSAENGKLNIHSIPDYNYFKWREGLFCFDNETVESLIAKMQLYYDIKIEVEKPDILQHRYSGKFRIKDGIEHVLKVLQLKHKFTYTKNEESNLIVIK